MHAALNEGEEMHMLETTANAVDAEQAMLQFYRELDPLHLAPLWESLHNLVPPTPRCVAQPFGWSWERMRPMLLQAGGLISAARAERRVLVLENPALPGRSQITDTLYAGLQLILPGEIAPAHRHTQSALRFVLEGNGGYTSVDGAKSMMRRGDFIVTPRWTWHDHGNEGDGPVIWLDGLDVPLVSFLHAGFREGYPGDRQAVTRSADEVLARFGRGLLPLEAPRAADVSPTFNYPYETTREALRVLAQGSDIDPCHGVCLRYANPLTGDWAIHTIAASMRLLPKGFTSEFFRSTDGAVVVAVEGEPSIEIEGHPPHVLRSNDVFSVPGWTRWRTLAGTSDAVLFVYSDRPVHERLALYREQRG
jgi:gentisate 1,2-dioxygenase